MAVFYFAQGDAGWASHKRGAAPVAAYASHQLSTLSARLKSMGHQPYLVDGRSFESAEQFGTVARGLEFDVGLAWVMPLSRQVAADGIYALRKAGKTQPIVAAGPSVSAVGERLANETCDLIGEIDEVFPKLLDRFAANEPKIPGMIEDGLEKPVADVDALPEIDRGHFNIEIEKATVPLHLLPPPIYTLMVGRGCPSCHDATLMGLAWRCRRCWSGEGEPAQAFRARDPHKWVDDVMRLTTSHGTGGVGAIVIHDSQFVGLEWLRAMASDWHDMVRRVRLFMPIDPRAILADPSIVRDLTRCGLTWTCFDVGHGANRFRRKLGVPFAGEEAQAAAEVLRRNRVNLMVRVTCGLPGETDSDVDATERLLRGLGAAKVHATLWRPCVGTALWDEATRLAVLLTHGSTIDGTLALRIREVDYDRVIARLNAWPPAYEAKIVDLPVDHWQAAPSPPELPIVVPKPVAEIPVRPAPHVAAPKPSAPGQPPGRDAWDAVLARLDEVRAMGAATSPKATVVTTVHDPYAGYLKEALHSIEEQTILATAQVEHVVIDNGTTRKDLAEYLAYKDSGDFGNWRPRVVRFPENVNNVATTWNAALSVARGEYVCFLDADNRKRPEFLARLVAALDADPAIDVAHCRSAIMDSRGNQTGVRARAKGGITLAEEVHGNWIDSGEMLVRRSVLSRVGLLDERMRACEDWDLVVRLLKAGARFLFVDELLAEYRAHSENRMHTSIALGAPACEDLIREKANRRLEWDVRLVTPRASELTVSQRQVIGGLLDSLKAVEWVRLLDNEGGASFACDVVLVVAPFRLGDGEIEALFRRVDNHGGPRRPQVVTLHMEDPQAVVANGRFLGRADWIVANDYSAMRHYRAKLADAALTERAKRVLCWNSLGASPRYLAALGDPEGTGRDVDVLVLGYAYPSRRAIVTAFVKDAPQNWRVVAVGDGWKEALAGRKVECHPTCGEEETARWCSLAKIVLVTHRRQEDIGGFPLFPPESVHRGFLEAAGGAVVLVDDVRTYGSGGVPFVRYSDGRDAARKAFELLKDPARLVSLGELGSRLCCGELSMASRVRAILSSVRDERYNAVIP